MSVERRVLAFYDIADADLDAAKLLSDGGNRNAGYHLQQAVEKLTKGLLLQRGREAGLEHRIDALIARLAPEDPWCARLRPFARWSTFATTFRYPTIGGRVADGAKSGDVTADVAALRALIATARAER